MIKVVNKKTHKPTKQDIYIGRPSALGNPFTHMKRGDTLAKYKVDTREEAVSSYAKYLAEKWKIKDPKICEELDHIYDMTLYHDVNLVCWCAPMSCHGDAIVAFLDELEKKDRKKFPEEFDDES